MIILRHTGPLPRDDINCKIECVLHAKLLVAVLTAFLPITLPLFVGRSPQQMPFGAYFKMLCGEIDCAGEDETLKVFYVYSIDVLSLVVLA